MLSEIAIGTEVMLGSKQASIDKQKIEQISLGLFEGALNEENLQDIVQCTTVNGPEAVADIETAIKDIEQKSISGIEAGIDEMATAF
jgi:hypothetical protein